MRLIRATSILSIVAMLNQTNALSSAATADPASPGSSSRHSAAVDVEGLPDVPIVKHSSATSDTTINPDGTVTLNAFTEPINYSTDQETWKPISNELVAAPGAVYDVQNEANDYTAKIPADASKTPIKVATDDGWVTMRMHGLDASSQVDGTQATFTEGSFAADAVTYEATASGLKEDIVLNTRPGHAPSYVYTVETSAGLTPQLTADEQINFVNTEGETALVIPRGVMYDSADTPETSESVDYALTVAGDAWTLTVTPDAQWLMNPDRVYPVTVDPTVMTKARDCTIRSHLATSTSCGTDFLRVGRETSTKKFRAMLYFNIASIPSDATVNSASVSVYLDASQSLNGKVANYGLGFAGKQWNMPTWSNSGAEGAWDGGDPAGAPLGNGSLNMGGGSSGWKTFGGLAAAMQGKVSNKAAYRGFVLKQVPEDVNNVLSFFATNAGGTHEGKRPQLQVSYTPRQYTAADECPSVQSGDNRPAEPADAAGIDTLYQGQILGPGKSLFSTNGNVRLTMQDDGNLVLFRQSGGQWYSYWESTTSSTGASATFQNDGNFVIYDASGVPLWHTWTYNKGGLRVTVQDDENLVVYGSSGAIWSSDTYSYQAAIASSPSTDWDNYSETVDSACWVWGLEEACEFDESLYPSEGCPTADQAWGYIDEINAPETVGRTCAVDAHLGCAGVPGGIAWAGQGVSAGISGMAVAIPAAGVDWASVGDFIAGVAVSIADTITEANVRARAAEMDVPLPRLDLRDKNKNKMYRIYQIYARPDATHPEASVYRYGITMQSGNDRFTSGRRRCERYWAGEAKVGKDALDGYGQYDPRRCTSKLHKAVPGWYLARIYEAGLIQRYTFSYWHFPPGNPTGT